jgi:hypothetical protein
MLLFKALQVIKKLEIKSKLLLMLLLAVTVEQPRPSLEMMAHCYFE